MFAIFIFLFSFLAVPPLMFYRLILTHNLKKIFIFEGLLKPNTLINLNRTNLPWQIDESHNKASQCYLAIVFFFVIFLQNNTSHKRRLAWHLTSVFIKCCLTFSIAHPQKLFQTNYKKQSPQTLIHDGRHNPSTLRQKTDQRLIRRKKSFTSAIVETLFYTNHLNGILKLYILKLFQEYGYIAGWHYTLGELSNW